MGAINSSYNYKNQPKTMPYKTAQPLAERIVCILSFQFDTAVTAEGRTAFIVGSA